MDPSPKPDEETYRELRSRARTFVYERLALASASIWALGAMLLMFTIVPPVAYPQRYIAVAMTVPLLPAALPWLFWGLLTDLLARRWSAQQSR